MYIKLCRSKPRDWVWFFFRFIFWPCDLVRHFQIRQFTLLFFRGSAISSPAFSIDRFSLLLKCVTALQLCCLVSLFHVGYYIKSIRPKS